MSPVLARKPREHRLIGIDGLLLFLPAGLWLWAFHSRGSAIRLWCVESPGLCSPENLPAIDRWLFGSESPAADGWSFWSQDTAGALLLLAPLLLHIYRRAWLKRSGEFKQAATDILIAVQITLWNGLMTELSRLVVQRPRPFVYYRVAIEAADSAHYTSFLSGHTSFTAAATLATFLTLRSRRAPWPIVALCALIWPLLSAATAYFRVMAGRHFLTDTIAAFFLGSLVAWLVFRVHRPRELV